MFPVGRLDALPAWQWKSDTNSTSNATEELSSTRDASRVNQDALRQASVNSTLGEERPNCGVTVDCGPAAFSLHIYTGLENKDLPKICVNGK